jgi:UDP-glucose 4-epimerase
MKILVTGHRGFIGSYLMKEIEAKGLDKVEGNDILDCDLPDADVVIHLAAQPGVIKSMEDPVTTVHNNITGTVRLAEKYKDTKFIFASSGGTIQETIESPYGLSKYCGEEFVKMICNNYVILRFANIYGKGSRSVADKFLNEDITIYGDGSATRTYLHIDDLIRGIIQSMDWNKGSYYLGSNQNYTVLEIAKAIGKPIKFRGWRKGELKYSRLENTTPNWEATTNLMDYVINNNTKL